MKNRNIIFSLLTVILSCYIQMISNNVIVRSNDNTELAKLTETVILNNNRNSNGSHLSIHNILPNGNFLQNNISTKLGIKNIYSNVNDTTKDNSTHDNYISEKDDSTKISPFSSVKLFRNQIFVSMDTKNIENWHQLLSINDVGIDALINFAIKHYGSSMCDFKIECYKYNIIKHLTKVYRDFQKEELPVHVSVEFQDKINDQNGMDIESTHEKYLINKSHLADNISLTKNRNLRIINNRNKGNSIIAPNNSILSEKVLNDVNKQKVKDSINKMINSHNSTHIANLNTNQVANKSLYNHINIEKKSKFQNAIGKLKDAFSTINQKLHNLPIRFPIVHNINNKDSNSTNNASNIDDNKNTKEKIELENEIKELKSKVNHLNLEETSLRHQMNTKIDFLEKEIKQEKLEISLTQRKEMFAAVVGGGIIGLSIVSFAFFLCYKKKMQM